MLSNISLGKILSNLNISSLNYMQEAAIAAIPQHDNSMLLARTGSGKTLAYLLPMLKGIDPSIPDVQCLILVPSRELALQIEQVWKKMGTGFKVNSCYGGHPVHIEEQNLTVPPAVLIGTPGRIMDHMHRHSFSLDTIKTLVLDEFDKSLDLGFEDEMSYIIGQLKSIKKRILVSATPAVEIPEFTGVTDPEVLDFLSETQKERLLSLKMVISEDKDKADKLFDLICYLEAGSALIFCNHREAAERASRMLREKGITSTFFHGGMEQMDREQTLVKFRNGTLNFLVATDLAARGLDIPEVRHVIHYHLPSTKEEFIHRNGRTARMHTQGTAYLIMHTEEQLPDYMEEKPELLEVPAGKRLPEPPAWTTVYISGGKKEKINKTDIVGFFLKKGGLLKEDLGLIEVKDFISFAAVKKNKVNGLLDQIKEEKMKGKKYRIDRAR
jgi:ATP-dependent RNA helicase DeaD